MTVLIGLFRGLHCPFCRRQLVQLGTTQEKLKAVGVETVAVVNTQGEEVVRAQLKGMSPVAAALRCEPEPLAPRISGTTRRSTSAAVLIGAETTGPTLSTSSTATPIASTGNMMSVNMTAASTS